MAFAVPAVQGVPALYGGFSPVSLLSPLIDISASLPTSLAPQWGIFLGGAAVVTADSVISMDARAEAVVSDYPLEGGTFESYDKVDRPFDVRFRFASGGNDTNRAALFASIKALLYDKSNQYMFIAPEDVFENVTISHFDYHRTNINGVGLPAVDVWGWQLLNNVNQTSGGTQSIGATPPSNNGSVQLQPLGQGGIGSDIVAAPLLSGGSSNTAYSP
jgi:hypothetical protein